MYIIKIATRYGISTNAGFDTCLAGRVIWRVNAGRTSEMRVTWEVWEGLFDMYMTKSGLYKFRPELLLLLLLLKTKNAHCANRALIPYRGFSQHIWVIYGYTLYYKCFRMYVHLLYRVPPVCELWVYYASILWYYRYRHLWYWMPPMGEQWVYYVYLVL